MISENELIRRYLVPMAGEGAMQLRDDAAILPDRAGRDLVATKDMLVAGVHFFADDPPASIARKALRVNLSDLAAKGARPRGFLLGLGLPAGLDEPWIEAFATALGEDAAAFDCPLLGGDTVRSPAGLFLSVTAFGEVEPGRMPTRLQARAGMRLAVTGTIGDAALGLRLRLAPEAAWVRSLKLEERGFLADRYLHPRPRNVLAAAIGAHARAAMDVSDGLIGDALKLASAPEHADDRCRPAIDLDRLPLSSAARAALASDPRLIETIATGGDDYEVLIATDESGLAELMAAGEALGVPVSEIGVLLPGEGPPEITGRLAKAASFRAYNFEHSFEKP